MRSSDNDFDEVWIEAALADEIDCARVSHLERTLLVLGASDPAEGENRRAIVSSAAASNQGSHTEE
jgi:hypothetical protein